MTGISVRHIIVILLVRCTRWLNSLFKYGSENYGSEVLCTASLTTKCNGECAKNYLCSTSNFNYTTWVNTACSFDWKNNIVECTLYILVPLHTFASNPALISTYMLTLFISRSTTSLGSVGSIHDELMSFDKRKLKSVCNLR